MKTNRLSDFVKTNHRLWSDQLSISIKISGGDVNSSENSITIDGASSKHTFKFTDYKVICLI